MTLVTICTPQAPSSLMARSLSRAPASGAVSGTSATKPANWSGYLSHSSFSPSFASRATSSAFSGGVQVPIGGSATQMICL